MRAERMLVAVAGSDRGDVSAETVHARLNIVAIGAKFAGAPWSLLHRGARGVDTLAEQWAVAAGIEAMPLPCAEASGANHELLAMMRLAVERGWAVRLEAFPGRGHHPTRDMINLAQGAGYVVVETR